MTDNIIDRVVLDGLLESFGGDMELVAEMLDATSTIRAGS